MLNQRGKVLQDSGELRDGLPTVGRVVKIGYLEGYTWRSWRRTGSVGSRLKDRVNLPDAG